MGTRLTGAEKRWVFWYALILIILTSLPYFVGFAVEGDDWRFTGFIFGVDDGNSYIAKMRLGSMGDWLFRTPYTIMPQAGVLAFLPYLLLGKLAQGPEMHTQLVVLYHLFRILVIPFAVWATYMFSSLFVEDPWWRKWITVAATVGGGLGWAAILIWGDGLLGSLPLDFISPETFGYLNYLGLPHLVLSRALLLLALIFYLDGVNRNRSSWTAGGILAILSLIQPLSVVTALAVVGAHLVSVSVLSWSQRDRSQWVSWIQNGFRTVLIPIPLVVYFLIVFSDDPYLIVWTSQNLILSPHPIHYLLAYALIILPVFIGGWQLLKSREAAPLLPLVWALMIPFLAYFPHNLQRRLPEGSWVALSVLAAVGFSSAFQSRKRGRTAGTVILGLTMISSLTLFLGGMNAVLKPSRPVYRTIEEVKAFEWLADNSDRDAVVLSSFQTSNPLPAWAGVKVIVGHGPESAFLEDRLSEIDEFFGADQTSQERVDMLRRNEVDYVLVGPDEEPGWDMEGAGFLEVVYFVPPYSIFRVILPE